MERNDICTDFLQIIAGTSNTISKAYIEASNNLANGDKAIKYLENFIKSIENVASKDGAVDKRISSSKGAIKDFVGYDNIKKSLAFLSTHKTPTGNTLTADLKSIHDSLEKLGNYYEEGYRKGLRLLMLEYESAMYLLITGCSMALAYNFDVTESNGQIKLVPKPKEYFGITGKKIKEMAEELSKKNHADYLDELLKAANVGSSIPDNVNESVFTEVTFAGIASTVELLGKVFQTLGKGVKFGVNSFRALRRTVFGIIPLIRSVIYLSYKRKADAILSLEQNIAFIEQNIDRLNTRTNMDPEKKAQIIKKQQAQIEAYKKRAEKLRAQLEEGEKDAAEAINKENPQLGNTDDDFVLESANDDDEYVCMFESGDAN